MKSSLSRKPRASARSPRSVGLSRCALPSNRTLDLASSEAIPGKPSRITEAGVGLEYRLGESTQLSGGLMYRMVHGTHDLNSRTELGTVVPKHSALW